ncbi:MAG: hypothetical protein ACJ8FO_05820 [Sphingomicrobium sp.]
MRKYLIGPALTGVGWLAGSYYGAQAQQLVHKNPSDTYDGLSRAIDNMRQSGTTHFEGGTPMPYEIRVDRAADQQLLVHLLFDGREGATTELMFTPRNGGTDTLVSGKIHSDRAVLGQALAGSSSARLAYAPDWMLNLLMLRPLLQQLGQQIEQGREAEVAGMSRAEWESSLPPDQQQQVQQWRQYDAARPQVDPDSDADRFTNRE